MRPWAQAQIAAATGVPTAPRPRVQRTAHGPAKSRCSACGEHLASEAAQTRHLKATGHARYEIIG